jgi:hypothetical protein
MRDRLQWPAGRHRRALEAAPPLLDRGRARPGRGGADELRARARGGGLLARLRGIALEA